MCFHPPGIGKPGGVLSRRAPSREAWAPFSPLLWSQTFAQRTIRSKEPERPLSSLAIHAGVRPNEILRANRLLDHAVVT